MNLYVTKQSAEVAASTRELEAAKRARTRKHSSGNKYLTYKVRRKWLFFWEVYERGVMSV